MVQKRTAGILALVMGIMLVFAFAGCEDLFGDKTADSITITNNTGFTVHSWHLKSPTASWNSSLYTGNVIVYTRDSTTLALSEDTLSEINGKVYDIALFVSDGEGIRRYAKYGVTISRGMNIDFTAGDFDDGTGGNNSGDDDPITGDTTTVTISNNTGYTLNYAWIKPSTSSNWDSYTNVWLDDGESTTNLADELSVNDKYDIQLSENWSTTGTGRRFTKYGVTISRNMVINFTTSDLDSGNTLPTITIQNRSGVKFDSVHIKPSSSSDWGTSMGSISNNYDDEIIIPISSSNYSVFDIQMRSSNPTNSYTRTNVSIKDGDVFMFTSADRDNPSIELPVIVLKNNTGYTLNHAWIKPSTSTDWGSYTNVWLDDGESITVELPQQLSAQSVYDLQLSENWSATGTGRRFTHYNVSVSEGMIVTFTAEDVEQ